MLQRNSCSNLPVFELLLQIVSETHDMARSATARNIGKGLIKGHNKQRNILQKKRQHAKSNFELKEVAVASESSESGWSQNKFSSLKELRDRLCPTVLDLADADVPWYAYRSQVVEAATKTKLFEFKSLNDAYAFLRERGETISNVLVEYTRRIAHKDADGSWMSHAAAKGTFADRIAALSLLIQDSGVSRPDVLKQLAKMASKPSRREAIMATDALKEILLSKLLPPRRKLALFAENSHLGRRLQRSSDSALSLRCTDAEILLWWFEDFLKVLYVGFVVQLGVLLKDSISHCRVKAIITASDLLMGSPEQEMALASILATALTNVGTAITAKEAATAAQRLGSVLTSHPWKRTVLVKMVAEKALLKINDKTVPLFKVQRAVAFLASVKYFKEKDSTEFAPSMVTFLLSMFRMAVSRCEEALTGSTRRTLGWKEQKLRRLQKQVIKGKSKGLLTLKNAAKLQAAKAELKFTATSADDLASNIRLFRALLTALGRAMPYVDRSRLPNLSETWKSLDSMVNYIQHASTKIQLLTLMFRLANLMETAGVVELDRDFTEGLSRLVYREIRQFSMVSSSGRNVLLRTLHGLSRLQYDKQDFSGPVAIWRRLLQAAVQSEFSAYQASAMMALLLCISKFKAFGTALLSRSEEELLEDAIDRTADFNSSDETEPRKFSTELLRKSYNPCGGTPGYARAENSPVWEIQLQTCSVFPAISTLATAVFSQISNSDGIFEMPSLDSVFHDIDPEFHVVNANVESVKSVLKMLCLKPIIGGEEVDNTDVVDSTKDLESGHFKLGAAVMQELGMSNGPDSGEEARSNNLVDAQYWKGRDTVYPYEEFVRRFCAEGGSIVQIRKRRAACTLQDEGNDDEIDTFLDKVLAEEEPEDFDAEDFDNQNTESDGSDDSAADSDICFD